VISRWNEFGLLIFAAYLAAAGFYFWARIQHTLDIGWVWWVARRFGALHGGAAAAEARGRRAAATRSTVPPGSSSPSWLAALVYEEHSHPAVLHDLPGRRNEPGVLA
jgi:hypothetical protein